MYHKHYNMKLYQKLLVFRSLICNFGSARLFVPLQKRKGYEMEIHDNHATSLFVGCNIGR